MYERCQKHDLALGPDGLCVVCRREANARRVYLAPRDEPTLASLLLTALILLGVVIHLGAVAWILFSPESFPIDLDSFFPRRERPSEAAYRNPGRDRYGYDDRIYSRTEDERYQGEAIVELPVDPSTEGYPDPYDTEPPAERFRPRDRADDAPERREQREADRRLEAQQARETAERDRRRKQQIERERQKRTLASARRSVRIIMYAASWCPSCTRARRYMRENGIDFTERDVDSDASAQQRLLQLNPRGSIPTFEIDDQVRVGFSPSSLRSAIDRAARERRY